MEVFVINSYKDKYPQLKGRALTNRLIRDLLGQDVDIPRDLFGKPFLRWNRKEEPPYISISHSGDYFACVIDDENIGIDIQTKRNIDPDKISRRFFSPDEREYISSDISMFFQVWTRKEAFAKYNGRGLTQIMSGDSILNRNDVSFIDRMILDDVYMSICRPIDKAGDEDYEIQFLD